MFKVQPLDPIEEIAVPSGIVRLTHRAISQQVDPRSASSALVQLEYKGYLLPDGRFQDYGDPVRYECDLAGLYALLDDTRNGKPAGVFRIDDVRPFIESRRNQGR